MIFMLSNLKVIGRPHSANNSSSSSKNGLVNEIELKYYCVGLKVVRRPGSGTFIMR